jgi:hypothetical protein
MVTPTAPGVIRAHEGCRVPHALTRDTLRFLNFKMAGAKSDEMRRNAPNDIAKR